MVCVCVCVYLDMAGVSGWCLICREIRAEKEKQRIIRTGRNKFNAKPKDVRLSYGGGGELWLKRLIVKVHQEPQLGLY